MLIQQLQNYSVCYEDFTANVSHCKQIFFKTKYKSYNNIVTGYKTLYFI